MNYLPECCEPLQWHLAQVAASPSLDKSVIAPTRNLLTPEAYKLRQQLHSIDPKLQQMISNKGLFLPPTLQQPISITNHCFSMSLYFAKHYRKNQNVQVAAEMMRKGVSLECAKTTALYAQLFDSNLEAANLAHVSETNFLATMRDTLANSVDLAFTKEITMRCPFERIIPYVKNELSSGEYAIPLTDQMLTLIKDEQGNLFVFDPDHGTLDLSLTNGLEWFENLLKNHKVHLTETLVLLKIEDFQPANDFSPEKIEVIHPEAPPKLTRVPDGNKRWGKAIFEWRGKTIELPWDTKTGHIYNNDSPNLIRAKCALLIPRTWLDTTIRTIFHIASAALNILILPFALYHGRQAAAEQLRKIKKAVSDIFRAPICGVLGNFAALYGLFRPLEGRRLYGIIERCLNRQEEKVNLREKHYTSPCFKPWNLEHVKDDSQTLEDLKRMAIKLHYFKDSAMFEIFCGCRHALPCFN